MPKPSRRPGRQDRHNRPQPDRAERQRLQRWLAAMGDIYADMQATMRDGDPPDGERCLEAVNALDVPPAAQAAHELAVRAFALLAEDNSIAGQEAAAPLLQESQRLSRDIAV